MISLFLNSCMLPIMILFAIAPLSLSNMMMIWFMMEINNFMFITIMMTKMNNKKLIFLYFLIQTLASFMFMYSMIINPMMMKMHLNIMLTSSLMIKLGMPPFHLWMIMTIKEMNWMLLFLALTFQKLIPLNVLSLSSLNPIMFMMIMTMSMIIPSVMMFNMTNIKSLLVYSSINQTGWMASLIFIKHQMWIIYMFMYMMIMGTISFILSSSKISNMFYQTTFKNFNLMMTILMMNTAGLPPLTLFTFKWTTTFLVITQSNLTFMMICMMINSLMMTFIYVKMMSWFMFNNKFESKMKSTLMKFKMMKISLIIMTILTPILMLV